MTKFRKKPVEIDAVQWFRMGDHPIVTTIPIRFAPIMDKCEQCGNKFMDHGACPTLEGHHIVCPGDWIITGIKGEHYPCKPDIFEATYESVN